MELLIPKSNKVRDVAKPNDSKYMPNSSSPNDFKYIGKAMRLRQIFKP